MASLQASLVGPSPSCTSVRKTSSSRSPASAPAFRRFAVPVAFRRSAGSTHSQRRQLQIVRADKTSVDTSPAKAVTDGTWEELVLKAKVPVLVDFWAPWCGPCRMLAPIIDELATEYGDKLVALKLNTDESPGIATEYGIRSIPTVMIFKNGQKLDTVIGAVPKSTLSATLDKYVD